MGDERHGRRAGKALYWGTSEWTADEIRAAWDIAERHHLHKPVMEQPQYNLFAAQRSRWSTRGCTSDIGLGLTTWSPLASGLLTGQVPQGGIPGGSRGALPGYGWLAERLTDEEQRNAAEALPGIADDLGVHHWHSSPSPGAPRTRTSLRSSPAPAGPSRWRRTWRRSRCAKPSTTR